MLNKLSQQEALEVLKYDPLTGLFYWKIDWYGCRKGDVAGYIAQGYRRITVNKVKYKACRLAHLMMTGSWPTHTIHHKNKNTQDDSWVNICDVTMKKQALDRRGWKNKKFNLPKNIYLNACGNYVVRFREGRKTLFCGTFKSIDEATKISKEIGLKLHGDFYCGDRK